MTQVFRPTAPVWHINGYHSHFTFPINFHSLFYFGEVILFLDMELCTYEDRTLSLVFVPNPTYLAGMKTSISPPNKFFPGSQRVPKEIHLTFKHQVEITVKPGFHKSGCLSHGLAVEDWSYHVGWIILIIVYSRWPGMLRSAHTGSPHQFQH